MVEGPSLYPHLTGRENLQVAGRLLGADKHERKTALETVGLGDAGDKLVRQYSLGMRQRLGIALALLGRPRLLVLDEPTNGLDPAGMADLRGLMQRLVAEAGMTIFLSSHLLDDVEKVATHVGLLHRGRLRAQGTLAALRTPCVRVACEPPGPALDLLRAAGYRVALAGGGWLDVEVAADAAAAVNRLLVQAGIGVSGLQAGAGGLARLFDEVTLAEASA
jgi:ABC-2 type transport system ATP-binding protein